MDRIEPVSGSNNDRPSQFLPLPESSNSRPTSYPRNRAGSLRSQRRPSIRISRLPSTPSLNSLNVQYRQNHDLDASNRQSFVPATTEEEDESWGNRRRSSSEPRPGRWSAPPSVVLSDLGRNRDSQMNMLPLIQESSNHTPVQSPVDKPSSLEPFHELHAPPPVVARPGNRDRLRRASTAALNRLSRNRASTVSGSNPVDTGQADGYEYDPRIVDFLDVIDPEVSTLSTLTNVQNSLFVPDLGGFLNRMPTYTLTRPPPSPDSTTSSDDGEEPEEEDKQPKEPPAVESLRRYTSISSALPVEDPRFAILPEDATLEGWSKQDIEELNDHVRHMLHSRRSKFKRAMKGFGQYVSKPLGFLVTLYATLITLFGLAWVLFLIGWINVGGRQLYIINVIDNVLVALFAIMGDGLAPFRAIDTYHMIFIAHYTFLTWKIRRRRRLPKLKDKNDLPARREAEIDVEWGDTPKDEEHEFSVLSPRQQLRLMHHQKKLSKSHTFYKPHETVTHHAFPLRMLIAIIVLLDLHSCFQIALGACTWSIDYRVRPFALTTVILCCSIVCNCTGGLLIMIGDRRTRKKEVVERMSRQQLTSEAMKKMEKRRRKEQKRNAQLEEERRLAAPSNDT